MKTQLEMTLWWCVARCTYSRTRRAPTLKLETEMTLLRCVARYTYSRTRRTPLWSLSLRWLWWWCVARYTYSRTRRAPTMKPEPEMTLMMVCSQVYLQYDKESPHYEGQDWDDLDDGVARCTYSRTRRAPTMKPEPEMTLMMVCSRVYLQ